MAEPVLQRAFAAGEIAPSLGMRADLTKYQTGLKTCRNFLVQRGGGITTRPGTKLCAEVKDSSLQTALYPFVYVLGVAYIIEASSDYFRFFEADGTPVTVSSATAYNGATAYVPGDLVSSGGVIYYCIANTTGNAPPNVTYWSVIGPTGTDNPYEVPTPYATGRFFDPARLQMSQAGNVLTITHLDEPPRELRYEGATRWVLSEPIETGPSIDAPINGAGTAGAVGTKTFSYVVTAIAATTFEESNASAVFTVPLAADPTDAAPNPLTWDPGVIGTPREYRIYSDGGQGNGTFGYIGTATGQDTFNDVGFAPDFSSTPPIARTLFDATNRYPATATTYQQRRVFGGCHDDRERIEASQTGFSSNFNQHSPIQESDAIRFNLASLRIQPVMHLLPLLRLAILTDSGEIVIAGDESGTLTPTGINPQNHAFTGSAYVQPVIIGNSIVYVQSRGSVLRALRFDAQVDGYQGQDLTVFASHLFAGYTIVDLAFQQVPHSTVWAVRSDGVLLGLTYLPEHDVWGWHRHDTDGGTFERVCVVPDGDEDAVFVVVQRGSTRFVERFTSRTFATRADSFCVDCGITYSGVAATSITGLDHLNGETVAALGDGVDLGTFTVSGGAITLPVARSKVQVGIPITYEAQTLELDVQNTSARDKRKRIASIALYVEDTAYGFEVGPDEDNLVAVNGEPWETVTANVTKRIDQPTTATWEETGSMLIRQTNPLPVTLLGVIPHVEIGG